MPAADLRLPLLQKWMQAVVSNTADDVREALAAPRARAIVPARDLACVVRPSRTLSSAERIGIYHGMYPLRMQEALATDYPAVAHFMGDDAFLRLVRQYVSRHPSSTYTLNRLGDHLPEHIARTPWIKRRAFVGDLARLERAVSQAFDAPESPLLDAHAVAAEVGERLAEARVRTISAFRLLALGYPASAYLDSTRGDEHRHPRVVAQRTWVVVFRRSFVVRRLELSRKQHVLLEALSSGLTIGSAVQKTLRIRRRRPRPEEFFTWFRDWVAAGLFQSLESGTRPTRRTKRADDGH